MQISSRPCNIKPFPQLRENTASLPRWRSETHPVCVFVCVFTGEPVRFINVSSERSKRSGLRCIVQCAVLLCTVSYCTVSIRCATLCYAVLYCIVFVLCCAVVIKVNGTTPRDLQTFHLGHSKQNMCCARLKPAKITSLIS